MSTQELAARDAVHDLWPSLPYAAWKDTYATLQLWTQIVGKVRMRWTPPQNHWWHVPLYVSARGLTSSLIPCEKGSFEIEFDLVDHQLRVRAESGATVRVPLEARSVAAFYHELMEVLHSIGVAPEIWTMPQEVVPAIPFEEDVAHASYDPEYARRLGQALRSADRVFRRFSSYWQGKHSPVHFFWGSFDLAVTRFSGRPAPEHPGGVPGLADRVAREAYSHEVSSAGWWPGGDAFPEPAFYAYAYPEPPGYRDAPVRPAEAFFHETMGEFILPYDAVRRSADPEATLMAFLQSTYEAAARCGAWDREALERDPVPTGSR